MVLRAREIMTERVVTARPDSPIALAEQRLVEFRFSALPVVDQFQRLVGIVSVVDILRHRDEHPGTASSTTVGSVMSEDILSMSPSADVGILAHRLRTYGEFRVMPIVERGVLVGVVTRSDLLRPRPRRGRFARLTRRVLGRDRPGPEPVTGLYRPGGGTPAGVPDERRVRDVMTSSNLVTIGESAATDLAVELLASHRFTALPVVDGGGRLVGIIGEADLLHDPLDGRRTTRSRTVGGTMTTQIVTLEPDAELGTARLLMIDRGFRVLPVVQDGRLVGVVSRSDLL